MVTIDQAAKSLWADYMGGEPGALVVGVGMSTDASGEPVINVWVRGEGPVLPDLWMGYPLKVHKYATHDKFGSITYP